MSRDEGLRESIVARAADAKAFTTWAERAKSTGWCRSPIRLSGSTQRIDGPSGEILSSFSSVTEPDRVLLKACGQRRATCCPSCSETYRGDAFQLVAAGLRGGKGVPAEVALHPAVFVTLTAPSFGRVHASRGLDGRVEPCTPGRAGRCEHGRSFSCDSAHCPDDPLVGQALCPDCYDYRSAVLWNAMAGELWRRTATGVRRQLASRAGIPRSALGGRVRLSFAKVVEYQRRGVVHLHVVARLDGADETVIDPPQSFKAHDLVLAFQRAADSASVPYPTAAGIPGHARWGAQLDIHVVDGAEGAVPGVVAGYLAKYATKSTDPIGLLDHRLREGDLSRIEKLLTPHMARMVKAAWELGGMKELADLRLRAWAHTLGFRGHWLTKSRAYSVTFGSLRAARHDWKASKKSKSTENAVAIGRWQFVGRGWTTEGDAWLAETAARNAAQARQFARLERAEARAQATEEIAEEGDSR